MKFLYEFETGVGGLSSRVQCAHENLRLSGSQVIGSLRGVGGGALMPIIRPNKGYLRKYSPLTPLPLTPLRIPMIKGWRG